MGAKARGGGHSEEAEENVFWVTMSDMMLGLAIVFIALFVTAMTGFSSQTVQQQKAQQEVSNKISEQIKKNELAADVDEMTGDLTISNVELFELGSSELTENGKKLLDKVIPIYVNSIFTEKDLTEAIEHIVVQGHTDSQMFAGVNSKDEQWLRNMDLSTKRANSVAQYIFRTHFDKQYNEKLKKVMVVEGMSFNKPVLVDGKEDFGKSRRVEIKLQVTTWDVMKALGLKR